MHHLEFMVKKKPVYNSVSNYLMYDFIKHLI